MANYDSELPIRSVAADNVTRLADSGSTTINPAKEDGNLATLAGGVTASVYQVNEAQVAGTATSVGSGTINAGTQRVVLATDQPNVPTNTVDLGGNAINLGAGNAGTGTQRVIIATDQPAIPVTVSSGGGAEKTDYATASVAAAATTTHSYTPVGTEILDAIDVTASGQLFITIQWGTTGSETTQVIGFTSKGSLNYHLNIPNGVSIPNTKTVKVIIKNEDKQTFDVFSTIWTH